MNKAGCSVDRRIRRFATSQEVPASFQAAVRVGSLETWIIGAFENERLKHKRRGALANNERKVN